MQTVKDYVLKVKQATGFGYWSGTFGQIATERLWNENKSRLPAWYGSHENAKYKWLGKRVLDCVGLDKYARWVKEDGNVVYDSSTDLNETMLFDKAKAQGCKYGTIDSAPDIEGIILWKSGHMGIYIGNGVERESRGGDYGVQDYAWKSRWFTHWFENPFIDYSNKGGEDMLEKGCPVSEAVGYWQKSLLKLKPDCLPKYGADNDFGGETETATKLFQKEEGLEQTGKVDEFTYGRMLNRLMLNNDKESQELCANFIEKSNALIESNKKVSYLEQENAVLENENALLERDIAELDKAVASYKFKADTVDERERIHKEVVDNLNQQIAELKTKLASR